MNAVVPGAVATQQHLKLNRTGAFSLCVDTKTNAYQPQSERFLDMLELLLASDADNGQRRSKLRNVRAELLGLVTNNHWYPSIHYLPADRGSIMHTHRTIIGALIQGASRAGLTHRSPLPTLSGVLGDFLEQLIALSDGEPRRAIQPQKQQTAWNKTSLGAKSRLKNQKSAFHISPTAPTGGSESCP